MQTLIDDGKLKQLLKEAVMEAFEEKKNILHDVILSASGRAGKNAVR